MLRARARVPSLLSGFLCVGTEREALWCGCAQRKASSSSFETLSMAPRPPVDEEEELNDERDMTFLDLCALLPDHVSKPHPDRLLRDWFRLASPIGVDEESRVCCPATLLPRTAMVG